METKQNVTYNDQTPEYVIKLKKRNYWWLLLFLLLLLPLLLLLRFTKDVTFKTVEASNQQALAHATVKFTYTYHSVLDKPQVIPATDSTNAEGVVVFKGVKYTLFQKLFFPLEKTLVQVSSGCFLGDSITPKFFDLKHNEITLLELKPSAFDLNFQVVDDDDNQPIPNAKVKADSNGQSWDETADANGMVLLKQVPYCADIKVIGSAYGYADGKREGIIKNMTGDIKNRTIRLKPIKDMVKFWVKDLYSKQPIPDALAVLIVENDSMKVRTNTNGIGKGVFENIRITKQMKIKASHVFYHDTITQTYKVDAYNKQSEEQRTIYLRPEMQNLTFKDVDGATNQPLDGVTNLITINGVAKGTQMSNGSGTFIVSGLKPNDKLSITASKPGYTTNSSTIVNKTASELNTEQSRIIPLGATPPPPPPPPGPRKNCRVYFSGTLVSDEPVEGHISVIYVVDKYSEYVGDGEYPDNKVAFPKAVATTFDGIAIDKGTRLIIYSKKNFEGEVLLDITGPALINNIKWQSNVYIKNFQTKTFKGDLEENFPPSCRQWSKNNMNEWDHGSLKIICSQ